MRQLSGSAAVQGCPESCGEEEKVMRATILALGSHWCSVWGEADENMETKAFLRRETGQSAGTPG